MPQDISWILKAVEEEAMNRARWELEKNGLELIRVMGVSSSQIIWLIHDYQMRTGKSAMEIDVGT